MIRCRAFCGIVAHRLLIQGRAIPSRGLCHFAASFWQSPALFGWTGRVADDKSL